MTSFNNYDCGKANEPLWVVEWTIYVVCLPIYLFNIMILLTISYHLYITFVFVILPLQASLASLLYYIIYLTRTFRIPNRSQIIVFELRFCLFWSVKVKIDWKSVFVHLEYNFKAISCIFTFSHSLSYHWHLKHFPWFLSFKSREPYPSFPPLVRTDLITME